MPLQRTRGQCTIELALILTAASFALVAMWPLIRDAVAGQWKAMADSFSQGAQYEAVTGVTIVEQCAPGAFDPATGVCSNWQPGP